MLEVNSKGASAPTITKTWKLNNEVIVGTYVFHSGPQRYFRLAVRILWTNKLGFELKHAFPSTDEGYQQAEDTVDKIIKAGKIKLEHWKEVYYPHKNFIGTMSD